MGFLPLLNININLGSVNWLVWAILIYFVIKIEHPLFAQILMYQWEEPG
jgi:hypothetical protein